MQIKHRHPSLNVLGNEAILLPNEIEGQSLSPYAMIFTKINEEYHLTVYHLEFEVRLRYVTEMFRRYKDPRLAVWVADYFIRNMPLDWKKAYNMNYSIGRQMSAFGHRAVRNINPDDFENQPDLFIARTAYHIKPRTFPERIKERHLHCIILTKGGKLYQNATFLGNAEDKPHFMELNVHVKAEDYNDFLRTKDE